MILLGSVTLEREIPRLITYWAIFLMRMVISQRGKASTSILPMATQFYGVPVIGESFRIPIPVLKVLTNTTSSIRRSMFWVGLSLVGNTPEDPKPAFSLKL